MKQVTVIGGGAAAAVVIGEILRQPRGAGIAITWLAGPCVHGRGIAYSTRSDHHVLNVRAAGMGLFCDDLGAFFRHASTRATNVRACDFLPRSWFGDFVESTLAALIDAARARGQQVDIRNSVATAVRGTDATGYLIETDDGARVEADAVVVAIGALPPAALDVVSARALDSGNFVVDAWQPALRAATPANIVIIGTGLTAVDVILQAATDWPDAHITAVSRHGHLPAAHLPEPGEPYEHQAELIETMLADPNLRRWSQVLREAAAEHGVDWRAVIDGLRPATTELWQALPPAERARFTRHLRSFWDPLRHRLPTATAATIDALRESGRLEIRAAHIERVDGTAPLEVHLRERGGGRRLVLDADLVVQATGPRLDASATRDPLVCQMLAEGLVCADTVGLGFVATNDGRLIDGTGQPARGLRAIGALLRGSVWECAAYAEIRALARTIAQDLVSSEPAQAPRSRTTPLSGLSRSHVALVT